MEKNGKTKNIVLAVLLVAVLTLSIAYAALSATLTINAQATVKQATWNVHFQEKTANTPICTASSKSGAATTTASITTGHEGAINADGTSFDGLQAEFKLPGDKVVCTWQVINEGTIDARLVTYNAPTVSLSGTDASTLQGKISATLTVDGATPVAGAAGTGNVLPATSGNVKDVVLTIEYDPNATVVPSSDVTATVGSTTFTYQQN